MERYLPLQYAGTNQPSSPALLPSLGEGCRRRDEGCCVVRHVDVAYFIPYHRGQVDNALGSCIIAFMPCHCDQCGGLDCSNQWGHSTFETNIVVQRRNNPSTADCFSYAASNVKVLCPRTLVLCPRTLPNSRTLVSPNSTADLSTRSAACSLPLRGSQIEVGIAVNQYLPRMAYGCFATTRAVELLSTL